MTIADLCADLGERQPVKPRHAARTCTECGSEDFVWVEQYHDLYLMRPTGRDMEVCNWCGEPTGRESRGGRVLP